MTFAQVRRNALISLPGLLFLLALPVLSRNSGWFQENEEMFRVLMNGLGTVFVAVLGFGVIIPIVFTAFLKPASRDGMSWIENRNISYHATFFEITDWEKR